MLLSKSDLLVNESYLNNRESIIDSNPINENFSLHNRLVQFPHNVP